MSYNVAPNVALTVRRGVRSHTRDHVERPPDPASRIPGCGSRKNNAIGYRSGRVDVVSRLSCSPGTGVMRYARTRVRLFHTVGNMADTEPQEVVPGAPGNDLMNALRYDSALSRTRHPWPPDILPRSHPPDAYLQNPARARQERPIGQDRRPRTHAPRACLTIALTCILTRLTLSACPLPCAPPPARQSLPGSKRHQPARQGINLTSTSPPRSSLHHRMPIIEALLKEAERAAASSNSSSEQQQHRAASNSSREQQQQQRSAAVIAAAIANSTYPPIHLYVHISHSVTSTSNECQAPYHTSYTYQVTPRVRTKLTS